MSWENVTSVVIGFLPILDSRREKEQDRVMEELNILGDAYYSTVAYYEPTQKNSSEMRRE